MPGLIGHGRDIHDLEAAGLGKLAPQTFAEHVQALLLVLAQAVHPAFKRGVDPFEVEHRRPRRRCRRTGRVNEEQAEGRQQEDGWQSTHAPM